MGRPMMPRPIKPIFIFTRLLLLRASVRSGRRVGYASLSGMPPSANPVHGAGRWKRWKGRRGRRLASGAEYLAPAQAGHGVAGGAVFAADPTLVGELVHPAEHVAPADLTGSGFVAGGNIGDLHVRDHRHELLHALSDVALGDLHVIDVKLQAQPVAADGIDDGSALRLGIEVIARHVAMVDRLDHHPD